MWGNQFMTQLKEVQKYGQDIIDLNNSLDQIIRLADKYNLPLTFRDRIYVSTKLIETIISNELADHVVDEQKKT